MKRDRIAVAALLLALVGLGVWKGGALLGWAETRVRYTRGSVTFSGALELDDVVLEHRDSRFRKWRREILVWDPATGRQVEVAELLSAGDRVEPAADRSTLPSAPWVREGVTLEEWWERLPDSRKEDLR